MNQLGINPEMDKLAREHELGHWSCVSPLRASLWVRSDGREACFGFDNNDDVYLLNDCIISELRYIDWKEPIDEDWQKSKQPTLVQKPFKYPCDGARYFTRKHGYQIGVMEHYAEFLHGSNYLVRTDAEKTSFYGRWNLDGEFVSDNRARNPDFDLIMFVWE